MALTNEEVGRALTAAFGGLPWATQAVVAILMYRSDPGYFDGLLDQMEKNGVNVVGFQRQADQLTAMVKEWLAKGRIEEL